MSLRTDLGAFETSSAIYGFAATTSLRTVVLALVASTTLFALFMTLGLLPVTSLQAALLAVMVSWLVCGPVSAVLALATGRAIRELARSRAEFERLSRTDMLSGLFNRRAFSEFLARARDNASLVIFDVDRFKLVNDQHGHTAGDEVIRSVSAIISTIFCNGCRVARLGGEEFGVIIEGGCLADRLRLVELARQRIAEGTATADGRGIAVTISAGVADICEGRSADAVYSAADKALYLAKSAGRNRIVHESQGFAQAETGRSDAAVDEAPSARQPESGAA